MAPASRKLSLSSMMTFIALGCRPIFHSGLIIAIRYYPYCLREHCAVLKANELIASMRGKGSCQGNAAMKIWDDSLKV